MNNSVNFQLDPLTDSFSRMHLSDFSRKAATLQKLLTERGLLNFAENKLDFYSWDPGKRVELLSTLQQDYGIEKGDLVEYISTYSWLESLNLSGLGLGKISGAIGQLTELRELDLTNNFLKELPDEIKKLTKLRSLHLSENPLQKIPDRILELKSLETLSAEKTGKRKREFDSEYALYKSRRFL